MEPIKLKMFPADQMEYEAIRAIADSRDYTLASLLMLVAFHGDESVLKTKPLGPLYLIQAFYLNRTHKHQLKELMV